MLSLTLKLLKNYASELNLFTLYCKDAFILTDIDCTFHWDKHIDHNPQFHLQVVLFNVTFIELHIYNVNHTPEDIEHGG